MVLNLSKLDKSLLEITKDILMEIGIEYSMESGLVLNTTKGSNLTVSKNDTSVTISYSKLNEYFRGLSHLKNESLTTLTESFKFTSLCYMADESRDSVSNIAYTKKLMRLLALMGYDSMMLYTEDTYELPGYKYFGHMRGRYSTNELKDLDDYAYSLGIELIPCIQVLAHMNAAIRWPEFENIRDIDDIILIGDENTYKFIDAMIKQCSECFRSNKINLGMDEAHRVGRGNYLTKNGYRNPFDIMTEHLDAVCKICDKYGFQPMMWSDMFFRIANNGRYFVPEDGIPQWVIDKIPSNMTLIYWDYYSMSRDAFEAMVNAHLKFNNPVAFAGGAWKWSGFGAHNLFSLKSSEMQIDVCLERGLGNVIVTGWGDDGAEASIFSNIASVLYFAERAYGNNDKTNVQINQRALDILDTSYEDLLAFDLPDRITGCKLEELLNQRVQPKNPSKYLLYNDPLEGFFDTCVDKATCSKDFMENSIKLSKLTSNKRFGYAFNTLSLLCKVDSLKCDLGIRIREAYTNRDKNTLKSIAENDIAEIKTILDEFLIAFRYQWYKENHPQCFSSHEIRIGGLRERLTSTALRLLSYVNGEIDKIDELEEPVLDIHGRDSIPEGRTTYINHNIWYKMINPGIL